MLDFPSLEVKYRKFFNEALGYEFRPQYASDMPPITRGFRLKRPESRRYQEPGEVILVYTPPKHQVDRGNDYRVKICTTKRRVGFVTRDSGFVLIVDKDDEIVYSKGPFIRTDEDFFDNLLKEGRVARWRVFYRPERCGVYMPLVHGRPLKSQYWQCLFHPKDRSHDRRFDDLRKPLPPEIMEERLEGRKKRRKKRAKIRAKGKDPHCAFKKRMEHPWVKEIVLTPDIDF